LASFDHRILTLDRIDDLFTIDKRFTESIRDVDWNPCNLLGRNLIAACTNNKQLFILSVTRGDNGAIVDSEVFKTDTEGEVWRVRWNRTGSMLGASGIEKDSYNKVSIFKTWDGKKWEKCEDLFVNTG
jgi:WD40 repeat protein